MNSITLTSKIKNDIFTEYLYNQYDIQNTEETVTTVPMLDINELNDINWNILLICGDSGSGKSTILNKLKFGEILHAYDFTKPIISLFPNKTPEEVVELYFSLGLSSVPSLLRTVNQLSNGEKARFELAWKLGNIKDNSIVYFDEFTSVVNRECAKSMSFALQRYVRKHNIKVVLASCHFDIIEWLQPDLIWNLNKQTNGECELEHFIFADDNTDYSSYKQINENEILSDERKI